MDEGRLPLPPELSPRRPGRSSGRGFGGAPAGGGRDGASRWLTLTAGTLSLVVLVVSGFAYFYYNQLNSNVKYVAVFGHKVARSPAEKNGAENILLVGSDDRTGATAAQLEEASTTDDGGGINTDTIILAHLAANNGPVTFISFPRDSVVNIPGHTAFKINSAYADGEADHAKNPDINGPTLLTETVENLTGAHIDHFVMVNFFQFIDISNAIGGVTVCVNGQAGYDSHTHADFTKAGEYTLKGSTALAYVRQRYNIPGGDFGRIQRQQRFISALVKKAKAERNPLTINQVLQKATRSLTADSGLNGTGFLKLVNRLRGINIASINFLTIPTVNQGATGFLPGYKDAVSYVKIDPTAVQAYVQNVLAGRSPTTTAPNAIDTATAIPASNVTVKVLNGAGISGIAARTGATLQQYGFHLASTGNATHGVTAIHYNVADAGAAKTLAKAVPEATLVEDSAQAAGTVELIVGTNFTSARNPATVTTSPTPSATPTATSTSTSSATAATQNCGP
jgi:LCP family protein required for cell wall assembly